MGGEMEWGKNRTRRMAHLGALWVLEALLENGDDAVGVEVDDEVGAAGEDTEGGLAREDVGISSHGEDLGL